MADVKISGLPSDSSLDGNHYVPINDPTGPTTKRTLLSTLAAFFFNQTNIPDGSGSPRTRMTETFFDFVASGCVWSGDAYASTRLASMTSGVVYINGRRLTISAVVSRTFTASKDTYIDILDNGDGTATIVYTEVANNAASPALAANSMRIGVIVTGASNIASAGSVNQGQENKVLPIASSIPYAVTDSLGNMICPRDPNRRILGYRQILADATATSLAQITGLSIPFTSPSPRKVRISLNSRALAENTNATNAIAYLYDGAVGAGTVLSMGLFSTAAANQGGGGNFSWVGTLSAGAHTINAGLQGVGGGTASFQAGATYPGYLMIELM